MAEPLRVFVSHSHQDNDFCQQIVQALRDAGADVWYDEHNLGPGVLRREIMRELSLRPIFLVVLSKAAFASSWVQDECEWAYNLYRRKPERLILPVVAASYDSDDFDTLLYLESLKRIEAANQKPYPPDEATQRLLRALALTPAGEAPVSPAPQPTESADDLLTRSKALNAQKKFSDALPLLERATQLAPRSHSVWGNFGYTLSMLGHDAAALPALERATVLDPTNAANWCNKGITLHMLGRNVEALEAFERATIIAPDEAMYWNNEGNALAELKRNEEALAAYNRALAITPNNASIWIEMGSTLCSLKRYDQALHALDRALTIDPNNPLAWGNKGFALLDVGHYFEGLVAFEQAIALDGNEWAFWSGKADCLRGLGQIAEAEAVERRARELGWQG